MKKRLALALVLAATLVFGWTLPAMAGNPTVTITMSAAVVSISNTQNTWNVGPLTINDIVYFSGDNQEDVDYSEIENKGNVAVNVTIKGTNAVGTYSWTLGSAAGNQTFSLFANTEATNTTYDIEVTTGGTAWISNLAKDATYKWSMKLTAPDEFDVADDGSDRVCTVTLVASKA